MKFKIGDVVRLKSGGADMVVERVDDVDDLRKHWEAESRNWWSCALRYGGYGPFGVHCVWHDPNGAARSACYAEDVLDQVAKAQSC